MKHFGKLKNAHNYRNSVLKNASCWFLFFSFFFVIPDRYPPNTCQISHELKNNNCLFFTWCNAHNPSRALPYTKYIVSTMVEIKMEVTQRQYGNPCK